MSEKWTPSVFWLLASVALPVMNLAARYRIIDGHKLPKSGAVILAPNHFSEIDPIIMGLAVWRLGRKPRFLAKSSLFKNPIIGGLLRASGQIPVDRTGSVRGSDPIAAANQLVTLGSTVIVYPEGTLTRDPDMWPMRGKTGAVRLALQQGIPIVPAAHWGTQEVMARYSKKISFFPRKNVTIKIGDPVDLSAFQGQPLTATTLNAATEVVMSAITGLLEELRHEKAPAVRWDPAQHSQKETGRFES